MHRAAAWPKHVPDPEVVHTVHIFQQHMIGLATTLQARITAHSVQAEAEVAQVAADAADDELRLVQAASGALYAAAEQANRAIALQATAVEMQKAADEARMMAEIQVGGGYTRLDCKQTTKGADCSEGHARQHLQ